MIALARDVMRRAYAPYSGFNVGTVLRGANGKLYAGCNVENAASPVGTCAEAGAIAAMVAAGETRIAAMLVLGNGEALVTPCGACRQRIREFAPSDALIHIADLNGIRRSFRADELLPASFGPANLGCHERRDAEP